MLHSLAIVVHDLRLIAMFHALRDHQAIDAIGSQIFHITVEQTCTSAIENSVAITDHRPNCSAGSTETSFADMGWFRAEIGIALAHCFVRLNLIWKWELIDSNLVLIRVSSPCPIEAAIGFVLFVFLEHGKRSSIQFGIRAVGIECRHAANGERSAAVANRDQKVPQVLKEGHVMRNGVAVGQNPLGITEIEVNQ